MVRSATPQHAVGNAFAVRFKLMFLAADTFRFRYAVDLTTRLDIEY